ncbi:unnamed protein product [Adineta ricciae]|uniref:Uncharacterized protein n=1 Tax=Adineta ricciae TaxID=249248 RepID=A0A814Z767_ADIRI|nr:unnamed protein product [Adineta ricciae]
MSFNSSTQVQATITSTGTSGSDSTMFKSPNGTLDGNGYISVIEYWNNRLVGSGVYGFRCISRCGLTTGSASNQFNRSRTVVFNNHGVTFYQRTTVQTSTSRESTTQLIDFCSADLLDFDIIARSNQLLFKWDANATSNQWIYRSNSDNNGIQTGVCRKL